MNTRRYFLMKSTIAVAGMSVLPSCIKKGDVEVGDRLNVAVVGVGGRGTHGVGALKDNPLCSLVAFTDVDDSRASEVFEEFPDIPRYHDFRTMMDEMDNQIDAVVIATPDHTHHYIAKWCMNMGKHVYVEKPLAHSISEVRDLMSLERKTGLACQMGNQGHSGAGMFLLNEWVKMGLLGDIDQVDSWTTHIGTSHPDTENPKGEQVPDTLDWDLWLGSAELRPYSSRYLPGAWRNWFDFGSGMLGDMACHCLDSAYRVLDLDCPKKIEIESSETRILSFPESVKITFTFPNKKTGKDVIVRWYHGPDYSVPRPKELEIFRGMGGVHGGTILYGSKNNVMLDSHAAKPRFFPNSVQRNLTPEIKESLRKLPESIPPTHLEIDHNIATKYHYNNWLLACKGEATCNSNFALSARLTEAILFANIALHLNCNLDIDPVSRTIIGNKTASKMINSTPRKGWEI